MDPLWIVLIIVLVVGSYVLIRRRVGKVREVLEFLALERGGQVRGTFGSYPQLTFQHDGVTLLVSAMPGTSGTAGGRHTSPQTFAQLQLPSAPEALFFRIRSRSIQTAGERLFGLEDVRIGDAAFDDRFVIETRDVDRLRELLSPDLRRRIAELDGRRGVHVSLERVKGFDGTGWSTEPRLDVTIDEVSTQRQDYADLIDTALLLLERIRTAAKP